MKEHEGGKSERKRETSAENPRPLGVAKKGEDESGSGVENEVGDYKMQLGK